MLKCFPIEFVRQALEQILLEEHIKNSNFYGGKDQVGIMSFYEQLKSQEEVNRFVENYRELSEQQNRSGLILNGVVLSPENPTITNIYSALIIPMTWTCSLRCNIVDRDESIDTINNLIYQLKGKKKDMAQLECYDENHRKIYVPFMVGTIGQNSGTPTIKNGDFIGDISAITDIPTILTSLSSKGVVIPTQNLLLYAGNSGKLKVVKGTYSSGSFSWAFVDDDGSIDNFVFPPEHNSFEKYKVSFSCDAIRCDEPRNLNSHEYCELTFSGSATLVSARVQLGNDLLKVKVQKYGILAESTIVFSSPDIYWLEPLEMPSGSNANTQINQLISNNFLNTSHTDAISLTLQYSFIYDKSIDFLKQLFMYARYGKRGITKNDISPNMLIDFTEIWCSWGECEYNGVRAKIVENIDIENTESDTLTLSLSLQVQGDIS